ncbi:ATP synthase F0F1 subunit delta [Paenibacillus yonginensis]|uniref:ATP synthase subunit delta n=1 Tax=Paenibacillus yonginensis TaxID=1462996 RepID=A0A1B1N3Z8_9BACL|nr:F0F1 ATP synthase subunit delta [Paenibacillus yonginensis]ANS76144.1 ATP synthase F0F1 subunit delta [Paenibacillus yonginensis]
MSSKVAVIASRYAKAIYEIAAQEGRTLEVEQELKAAVEALTADKEIVNFIAAPSITDQAKLQVIETSLADKLSKPVVSLLKLLVERGRVNVLPELLESYIRISGEALGLATAVVYTTYPLNEEEKQEVSEHFGALVQKKIRVENVVDNSLLGGMKVVIGDTLYDGSLAGKLDRLEKSFRRQAL